jgi:2-amino-4-ketopentanoate thiolase beta subunit
VGDPRDNVPGKRIVIPERLEQVRGMVQDMDKLRKSYLKNAAKAHPQALWSEGDFAFLAADLKKDVAWVKQAIQL